MTVLGSDGLHLSVGDGVTEESFLPLIGTAVTTLEITQAISDGSSLADDAWQVGVATDSRRLSLTCNGIMTDDAGIKRLRSLSVGGGAAHYRLALDGAETMFFMGLLVRYQETIEAGAVKRFTCQLVSSGAVTVAG